MKTLLVRFLVGLAMAIGALVLQESPAFCDPLAVTFTATPSDGGTLVFGGSITGTVTGSPATDSANHGAPLQYTLSPQLPGDTTPAPGAAYSGAQAFSYTPTAVGPFVITATPVLSGGGGGSMTVSVVPAVALGSGPVALGLGAPSNSSCTLAVTITPPGTTSDSYVTYGCVPVGASSLSPVNTEMTVSAGSATLTPGGGSDTVLLTVTAASATPPGTGGPADAEIAVAVNGVVAVGQAIVVIKPTSLTCTVDPIVNTNQIYIPLYTVTLGAGNTGGTFTLGVGSFNTSALACNATASDVQSALTALSLGTGTATVSGSAGGPYTVTFSGWSGDANLTGAGSLTGGANTVTIAPQSMPLGATPPNIGNVGYYSNSICKITITIRDQFGFQLSSMYNSTDQVIESRTQTSPGLPQILAPTPIVYPTGVLANGQITDDCYWSDDETEPDLGSAFDTGWPIFSTSLAYNNNMPAYLSNNPELANVTLQITDSLFGYTLTPMITRTQTLTSSTITSEGNSPAIMTVTQ